MLRLTLRVGETVTIGDEIEIVCRPPERAGRRAFLSVRAPADLEIRRHPPRQGAEAPDAEA